MARHSLPGTAPVEPQPGSRQQPVHGRSSWMWAARMVKTRSAVPSTSRLWVAIISVALCRRQVCSSSASTSSAVSRSRLPVGSSANTMFGRWGQSPRDRPPAAVRPPDSSSGNRLPQPSSPSSASSESARPTPSALAGPVERHGEADVFRHGQRGDQVEELEHESQAAAPHPGKLVLGQPRQRLAEQFHDTVPWAGPAPRSGSAGWTCPEPLRPTTTTNSPGRTFQVALFQDHVVPVGFPDANEAECGSQRCARRVSCRVEGLSSEWTPPVPPAGTDLLCIAGPWNLRSWCRLRARCPRLGRPGIGRRDTLTTMVQDRDRRIRLCCRLRLLLCVQGGPEQGLISP